MKPPKAEKVGPKSLRLVPLMAVVGTFNFSGSPSFFHPYVTMI